jgi:hypothetical protein
MEQRQIFSQINSCEYRFWNHGSHPKAMRMLNDKMYRPAADNMDITKPRGNNKRLMEVGGEREREQKTAGPVHDRMVH